MGFATFICLMFALCFLAIACVFGHSLHVESVTEKLRKHLLESVQLQQQQCEATRILGEIVHREVMHHADMSAMQRRN